MKVTSMLTEEKNQAFWISPFPLFSFVFSFFSKADRDGRRLSYDSSNFSSIFSLVWATIFFPFSSSPPFSPPFPQCISSVNGLERAKSVQSGEELQYQRIV